MGNRDAELLIEPACPVWDGLMRSRASAGTMADAAGSFRAQMGLATGSPIVMSGHQAGFWHPGIVAKYAAVGRGISDASTAWIVADIDDNEPTRVRVPRRDERGVVRAEVTDLAANGAGQAGTPTGLRPPVRVSPEPVGELARAAGHLRGLEGSSNLAEQVHGAAAAMLDEVGATSPGHTVYATAIAGTDLFAAVLAEMGRDPQACVRHYNDAVAEFPRAGVRALSPGGGRWELPVWRVGRGGPRVPVKASAGENPDPSRHAPRGLLMTGLMRAAGCDLFIHGTGGGVYDRITERWLGAWLGMRLAPLVVVSATLRLDLGFGEMTPETAQAAIARAHRAEHDPGLLGDEGGAAAKRELVDRIAGLARGAPERRRLYGRMHALIADSGARGSDRLWALREERDRGLAVLRSRDAVTDRTWSFVLHDERPLRGLIERVRSSVAGFRPPAP